MSEFFTIGNRQFEFGRTVGDAKRLLKRASPEMCVFVSVRNDESAGWGRSSATLSLSRAAFRKSLSCDDGERLISHLHQDGDGPAALWIGSPLAIEAASKPREIAA